MKVVVVTGASSGIGLALVKKFISEGFITYGIGQRDLSVENLRYKKCDVTNSVACFAVVEEILAEAGSIDILVNNAGIGISGPAENTAVADAKKMFDVNFFGAFNMIAAVLPIMRKQKIGSIVSVSSMAGFVPIPFQSFYSATKAALDIFAAGVRMEVAQFNVKVVNVHPGDVATGFTDRREKQRVDEVSPYAKNCNSSIAQMEKDERGGMAPEYVAGKIYKTSIARRPKLKQVIGRKYRFFAFLLALMPQRLREWAIKKMYF